MSCCSSCATRVSAAARLGCACSANLRADSAAAARCAAAAARPCRFCRQSAEDPSMLLAAMSIRHERFRICRRCTPPLPSADAPLPPGPAEWNHSSSEFVDAPLTRATAKGFYSMTGGASAPANQHRSLSSAGQNVSRSSSSLPRVPTAGAARWLPQTRSRRQLQGIQLRTNRWASRRQGPQQRVPMPAPVHEHLVITAEPTNWSMN